MDNRILLCKRRKKVVRPQRFNDVSFTISLDSTILDRTDVTIPSSDFRAQCAPEGRFFVSSGKGSFTALLYPVWTKFSLENLQRKKQSGSWQDSKQNGCADCDGIILHPCHALSQQLNDSQSTYDFSTLSEPTRIPSTTRRQLGRNW